MKRINGTEIIGANGFNADMRSEARAASAEKEKRE